MFALTLAAAAAWALPDLDEPLRSGASAASDAAVVVGIEDYLVAPDVPHAARDARAVYDFLVYTRGIPTGRVRLLDQGASREHIESAVRELGASVGAGGTLWFYFAGHGATSPKTSERLLVGDDARPDPAMLAARSVSVPAVRRLATAGGGDAVLLLDTSFGGKTRDGSDLIEGQRFLVPAYAAPTGDAVLEWTAAGAGEVPRALADVDHGAFTWLVLGALRGWADGELTGRRDGDVSIEEAQLYVNQHLRGLASQRPQLSAPDPARTLTTAHERAPSAKELRGLSAAALAEAAPAAVVAAPAPAAPLVLGSAERPAWTTTEWRVVGELERVESTGIASGVRDPTLARKTAKKRARTVLLSQLQLVMDVVASNQGEDHDAYDEVRKRIYLEVTVAESWTSPDGVQYARIELSWPELERYLREGGIADASIEQVRAGIVLRSRLP